jgi:hypothetical protein
MIFVIVLTALMSLVQIKAISRYICVMYKLVLRNCVVM